MGTLAPFCLTSMPSASKTCMHMVYFLSHWLEHLSHNYVDEEDAQGNPSVHAKGLCVLCLSSEPQSDENCDFLFLRQHLMLSEADLIIVKKDLELLIFLSLPPEQ